VTTYSLSASVAGSVSTPSGFVATSLPLIFSISPVSYEIKVRSVDYSMDGWGTSAPNSNTRWWAYPKVYRYASGSASGGSSLTAIATRQGSAAASSTCRGGNLSLSGTQQPLASAPYVTSGGGNNIGKVEFPVDITVSPGSMFVFNSGTLTDSSDSQTSSITMRVSIYFEELRLAWPY